MACHGVCLLQPDLVPLSSSSWPSLLNAFRESSEGIYPTQEFSVQDSQACQEGRGQGRAVGEEDHMYIKPVGHGPCNDGHDDAREVKKEGENEAILVLYGRRRGLSEALVHRLELGVRDYILPSARGKKEDINEGGVAEEEENERNTVLIPGGLQECHYAYVCRFEALAACLATHFLSKLRPELYAARQLPSFSDVMRTEGIPTSSSSSSPSSPSSTSFSSPSLLLNELLHFLSCSSMLRLSATARQYQQSLAQEERTWKIFLQRDFPVAAASLDSSSTTCSKTASSGTITTATPCCPPARTAYRCLFQARPRPLPSRLMFRPDDRMMPFYHLPPSHVHPFYPSFPHPLHYASGGLDEERTGERSGAGEARPRFLPAFGMPPLWYPGRRFSGVGGREEGEESDDREVFRR